MADDGGTGALEHRPEGDLPEGWTAHVDAESGRPFFYNAATGERSWDRPTCSLPSQATVATDLPEGWTTHVDAESGQPFFYNATTGERSWDRPTGSLLSSATAAGDLPEGWTTHVDAESGRPFFYNAATGERSWDRPSGSSLPSATAAGDLPEGWTTHVDAESGRPFFHNAATGETSWYRPGGGVSPAVFGLVSHPASVTDTPDWVRPYTRYITTTVPAEVKPNEKFSAITPKAEVVEFICEAGCGPGTSLTIAVVDTVVPAGVSLSKEKFTTLDGQELTFPEVDAKGTPIVEGATLPLRYTPLHPESVFVLPPDRRMELKMALEEAMTRQSVRLKDAIFVCKLTEADVHHLLRYLRNDYEHAPAKSFWPERNIKVGYDANGLFINQQHWRRYVGMLVGSVVPTPPLVSLIKENLHDKLFELIFDIGDKNKDGKMDKAEFQLLLRRVIPTLSTGDVGNLYRAMDRDNSNSITCGEFVLWLKQKSKSTAEIRNKLSRTLVKEGDYIKACFRLLDKDGDGSISERELKSFCTKVCPNVSPAEFNAFFNTLNADGSRNGIDYSEFVDSLGM